MGRSIDRNFYRLEYLQDALSEEDREKLEALAALIGQPLAKIEKIIDTKTRKGSERAKEVSLIKWAYLAKGLDEDTYDAVCELGIKGVYGNRKYSRTYPGGQLAAHVLGYVNHEETPVTGIERFFDYYLRGQDGWRETERDGRRRDAVPVARREPWIRQ